MNQCISDYIPEPNDDDHIIITFEKSANWHRARCGDLVTGWYREQRQAVESGLYPIVYESDALFVRGWQDVPF